MRKYKPGLDALITCAAVQGVVYLLGVDVVQMHAFLSWCFASIAGIGSGFNYYIYAMDKDSSSNEQGDAK